MCFENKQLTASSFFTIVDEFWWFSMQKTADGLKEGVQKSVFSTVSGIGRARSTDIVFFQKQEKVFVRVPNDLKCYENRDFTCLGTGTHHGRSPLQNLNLAGKLIWGNITLFNHYLSRANHQQTQKIIDFNMSFCI